MSELSESTLLLAVATALLVVSLVAPRFRHHWPLWVQVVSRVGTLVALTLLVQRILGSPLRPRFDPAPEQFWEQLIEAAWWMVAARAAVSVVRLFLVLEQRPRETRIVSDLLAGSIYVATMLAVVNFAFAVPVRGLLATSGVIAIVLGLALQSTLSDVFSGIAVGLERPYQPGDLLWVEGGIEGQVSQVNWRSTHIVTDQGNVAVVPNSVIAKSRLVNRSAPTVTRGDELSVRLDARAPVGVCLATLEAASLACRIPLEDPAMSVVCNGLNGDGVQYAVSFSVASSGQLGAARSEIFASIQRHVGHAGIALAVGGIAAPSPVEVPTLRQLLAASDLFGVLGAVELDALAARFEPLELSRGDKLIREGDTPEALFVIASGTAEISRGDAAKRKVVYRISPGESLGVVALISGTPYTASASALTPMRAYRLSKAGIAQAMKAQPDLAAGLEALAQRGQAFLARNAAAIDAGHPTPPEMFLPKLRELLRMLAS